MADQPIIRPPQPAPPAFSPAPQPGQPQPVIIHRPGDPGAPGGPLPTPSPGGSTQYIYIQTIVPGPAPTQLQPGAPVPPIMTGQPFRPPARSVQVQYDGVRRRSRHRGTSALGAASLILGIIACVIYWLPNFSVATLPVAALGICLGLLGFFVSLIFRRSTIGLPFSGAFVCAIAAGIAVSGPDRLHTWYGRARHAVQGVIAPVTPIPPTNHATAAPSGNSALSPVLNDILTQLDALTASANARIAHASTPIPTPETPPSPAPAIAPSAAPLPPGRAGVKAAMDRLTAARHAARDRALASPSIASLVAAANTARQRLQSVRQTAAPGGQELRDADTAWVQTLGDATSALNAAIETDPQVVEARQQYQDAYDALRNAPQSSPPGRPATSPPGTTN